MNWCIGCLFGATRCRAEIAVTFASRSLCVGETAVAFARPKCVFLRHCGRAKVSLVSCAPVKEEAKAVVVSFGREIVRPAALCHRESAKKFAQRAQNTPNSAFLCVLGEIFRGKAAGGPCWANFVAPTGTVPECRRRSGSLHVGSGGAFSLHEAFWWRVAGVLDPRVVQFPPLLSAASGFVCTPGFPRVLMGAHTFSLCSRNVTVSQVCSRHIQRRLWHRIRAGTPAEGASITSTTTRP